MTFPSEPGRPTSADERQRDLMDALRGYPRLAGNGILRDAMDMLQAQILSRRAIIGQGGLEIHEVDSLSREIQIRAERIRLIVAELRRRGLDVEWEE